MSNHEFEMMKQHAYIGYELLKDEPNLPLLVAHCAYQHHERLNGSGYPSGIKGNEIHDYAKWIGLVDSYDAMTTNRVYRSQYCRMMPSSGYMQDLEHYTSRDAAAVP